MKNFRFSVFKNFVLILLGLYLPLTQLSAAPYPEEGLEVTLKQADGSVLPARVFGDEYYAVTKTADGFPVVRQPDGFWYYATPSADGSEWISSGQRADGKGKQNRQAPDKALKEKKLSKSAVEKIARGNHELLHGKKNAQDPQVQTAAQDGATATAGEPVVEPSAPSTTTTGEVVGLTLLIDFPDDPATISQKDLKDLINQPTGFSKFSNACSVHEYFRIQSGGKLSYTNMVTAYVRVSKSKAYYDDPNVTYPNRAREMIQEALTILKNQGYDFSKPSRNANGEIISLNVFYAGGNAGTWSSGLWPHRSALWPRMQISSSPVIYAYDYQISNIGSSPGIGTFCHENGHMLCRFPDLYSYDGNPAKVNKYCLMGGSNSYHPYSVSAYLKTYAGWTTTKELNAASNRRCAVQAGRNTFFRFLRPGDSTQSFIFEARHNSGYEGRYGGSYIAVNPGSGLVAYHAKTNGSNTYSSLPTSYASPYELLVMESGLLGSSTWFHTPNPATAAVFSAAGISSASDAQTGGFKWWDSSSTRGGASGLSMRNVSAASNVMSFEVGTSTLPATPLPDLTESVINLNADYGSNPANQSVYIYNAQGGTLNYAVSSNAAWRTPSLASGSATTEMDELVLSFNTAALASGTYTALVSVSDQANPANKATLTVTIKVLPQPVISVNPSSITLQIAPDRRSSTSFTISNGNYSNGARLDWTLTESANWLASDISSSSVAIEGDVVTLSFDSTNLDPGTYNTNITISSPNAASKVVPVTLNVVAGSDIWINSPNGGEKLREGQAHTVTWRNIGTIANVALDLYQNDLFITTLVTSTPNDGSHALIIPAQYGGKNLKLRIRDLADASRFDLSDAAFSMETLVYAQNFEVTNDWTLSGDFEVGIPGAAGRANACPSAYSPTKALCTKLTATYTANTTSYAVSPAVNLSGYEQISIEYRRWLRNYWADTTTLAYSNDGGTSWNEVWRNVDSTGGAISPLDTAWSLSSHALSLTPGSNFKLRFALASDATYQEDGWNIDDVNIYAVSTTAIKVLNLAASDWSAPVAAGSTTLGVSANVAWTAVSSQAWLTSSALSGSGNATLTISAAANTTAASRTATLTFSASGVTNQVFTVTQAAGSASLVLSSSTWAPAATASTTSLGVTANVAWTALSSQAWLTSSALSGSGNATLTISAAANTTTSSRTATLTFSASGVTNQVFTVTQAAGSSTPTLSLASNSWAPTSAASSTSLGVTANVAWTAVSSQAWLTSSALSGSGNATLTVSAAANTTTSSRTATLTFSASGVTNQVFTVTQAAGSASLVLSASSWAPAATAATTSLGVSANVAWTALSSQTWLTSSALSGSGNATLTISAAANTTTSSRSATLTFSASGVTNQVFTVTQAAGSASLVLSSSTWAPAATASTTSLGVTANVAWTAVSSQAWLTSSALSGSGNATLTVSAAANTTASIRSATLTFSASGVTSKVFTVTQAAGSASLVLSASSWAPASAASTTSLGVTANVAWTAVSSQAWLTSSALSASGNATLTVSAAANPTTSSRSATLTFSASGVTSKVFTVTQAAAPATLSLSAKSWSCKSRASSTGITVSSNSSWTVSSSAVWITATPTSANGNQTVTVSAAANSDTVARTATLTFSASGVANQVFTVTQSAATKLVLNPASITTYNTAAHSLDLQLQSNSDWQLLSQPEWLSSSSTGGNGDSTLQLAISAEEQGQARYGQLVFSATLDGETVTRSIDIAQAPDEGDLHLSQLNWSAPANAATQSMTLTCNGNWIIMNDRPGWLKTSTTKGSGNANITFSCAANPNNFERSAELVFYAINSGKSIRFSITQQHSNPAAIIKPAKTAWSATTPQLLLPVTANCEWQVSSVLPDWINIEGDSGKGNAACFISVKPNTSGQNRSFSVVFSSKDSSAQATLVITQPGLKVPLALTCKQGYTLQKSLRMPAAGGNAEFEIHAASAVTALGNADWLSARVESGLLKLQAAANSTGAKRSAAVNVQSATASWVLTVAQDAASVGEQLVIAKTAYKPSARASLLNITLSSNCNWQLDDSQLPDWMDVIEYAQNRIVLAVQANPGTARSASLMLKVA